VVRGRISRAEQLLDRLGGVHGVMVRSIFPLRASIGEEIVGLTTE
jgi:hypothetical protein